MPGTGLVLRAVEVTGPLQWRWLLSDAETGVPLADHQVGLDPRSVEVARFGDLYGYAQAYAAPDRRVADEARIVTEAGTWAGRALLGEPVGTAIARAARSGPVTVRVVVPPELEPVLTWPLELAHVGGDPLAARGNVTLIYDIAPENAPLRKTGVAEALRVLAVFSQPTRTSVLALRRERYALGRLIRRIAARQRAAVELRVVQYGVTRGRLREIAEDADGWDVLHLSGHGGRGLFLLEHDDGSPMSPPRAAATRMPPPGRTRSWTRLGQDPDWAALAAELRGLGLAMWVACHGMGVAVPGAPATARSAERRSRPVACRG